MPRAWTDPLVRSKQWKMENKFGKICIIFRKRDWGGGMNWIDLAHDREW